MCFTTDVRRDREKEVEEGGVGGGGGYIRGIYPRRVREEWSRWGAGGKWGEWGIDGEGVN